MAFMKRNAATIYVAKRHRRYIHRRLFREIFRERPALFSNYTFFHKFTFTEDIPGKPRRKDDSIIVVGGDEFMEKLAQFPEDEKFFVNDDWSPTIRGGNRVGSAPAPASSTPMLSPTMNQALVQNLAEETARAMNIESP